MSVADKIMITWISGNIRKDKVWNESFHLNIDVAHIKCVFGSSLKNQLILLFNLFFLLFMNPTALFDTIYGFRCTISANFYLYLQYFQQKVFSFSKISGSQTKIRESHPRYINLTSQPNFCTKIFVIVYKTKIIIIFKKR